VCGQGIYVSSLGVPNLGYMYPQGYICLFEGVHLRLAIEEKIHLRTIYFQIFIHISVNNIFKNLYMLLLNISMIIMIKYFVIKNFRGTYSSVEMLKGYMIICWKAEGVHGRGKVGNSFSSFSLCMLYPVRIVT